MNAHSEQLNRKKYAAMPWSVVLLTANVVGAVIYVVAASRGGWVIPQERAAGVAVTGEPFVWAVHVFPICVVFFVLNLTWGVFILARQQWRIGILWLVLIPIWMVAVAIDFAHH